MIDAASQSDSGTRATAVTRWTHQCCTPSFAGPRPRARPTGVRIEGSRPVLLAMVMAARSKDDVAGEPGDQGQRRGEDDDRTAGLLHGRPLDPPAARQQGV